MICESCGQSDSRVPLDIKSSWKRERPKVRERVCFALLKPGTEWERESESGRETEREWERERERKAYQNRATTTWRVFGLRKSESKTHPRKHWRERKDFTMQRSKAKHHGIWKLPLHWLVCGVVAMGGHSKVISTYAPRPSCPRCWFP